MKHTQLMCVVMHPEPDPECTILSEDVSFLSLTLVVEFCKMFMCEKMHRNSVLMLETVDKTITPRCSFVGLLAHLQIKLPALSFGLSFIPLRKVSG